VKWITPINIRARWLILAASRHTCRDTVKIDHDQRPRLNKSAVSATVFNVGCIPGLANLRCARRPPIVNPAGAPQGRGPPRSPTATTAGNATISAAATRATSATSARPGLTSTAGPPRSARLVGGGRCMNTVVARSAVAGGRRCFTDFGLEHGVVEGDAANDVALLGHPLGVFGFPLIAVTDDDVVRTGAYPGSGNGADKRLERQLANGAVPAPGSRRRPGHDVSSPPHGAAHSGEAPVHYSSAGTHRGSPVPRPTNRSQEPYEHHPERSAPGSCRAGA